MLLMLLMLSVTACDGDEDTIKIASKPFSEQYIIAEMLVELIEDRLDVNAEHVPGITGGTANIHPSMIAGEIDIYPEYTGTAWLTVLKEEPMSDADAMFDQVVSDYQDLYDITWYETYGFNNTYGLAIKESLATERGIETYSDLAEKGSDLNFASTPEFFEREDGYPGLQETYGMDFEETTEMAIALKYDAIAEDQVDIITVFLTDALLEGSGLVVLEDDLNFFVPYYASTLVRNETLDAHPGLDGVLALLEGVISPDEMIAMNYQVDVEGREAEDVAHEFLVDEGLVE
jgi:glycine betaine/choline ABC-type transport system substrate-binding protein